ncbi:MAG: glycosyltransferase family 2 protein [Clostridia bacterium]|nr:glycosyltransferase family 2 protein [Clostridia bacterium]
MSLISVIIPAYNIEVYLARTLDSVLAQSYPNIEIIVVNDGSKDATGKVADEYAEKYPEKIKVFHIENGGVTNARLTGVEKAKGDWIGFVDGDDIIDPDMYERLLGNALKYNAEISHCGYQMVFPSRTDLYYGTGKLVEQDHITGQKDLLEGLFIEPGLVNKLFKKSIFEKSDIKTQMDFSIKNTEDLLMNYYLFSVSEKSVFEDFCPYHYLVRQDSAANKSLNIHQLLDPIKVSRHLLAKDMPKNIKMIVERKLIRELISLSTRIVKENSELIRPVRKEARKELRSKLGVVIKGEAYGVKLKIMALWAGIWPWSYWFVHRVYSRINGNDKKYEFK